MTNPSGPGGRTSWVPTIVEVLVSVVVASLSVGFLLSVLLGVLAVPVRELPIGMVSFVAGIAVTSYVLQERLRYERLRSFAVSLPVSLAVVATIGAIPLIVVGGLASDSALATMAQAVVVVAAYVLALGNTFAEKVRIPI